MKAKWLLGATLALFGAGSIAMAQDSSENKQPPPPPGQNDNHTPPAQDNKTPPPSPTGDHQNPTPATDRSSPPPPAADGQGNTQGQQFPSTTTHTNVQANGQFQTGQQTQIDQRGVAADGQARSDQWQWPQAGQVHGGQVNGQVQAGWTQSGQYQPGYNQSAGVQRGPYQQGTYQGRWVQGQYQPGYVQGGWSQGTQVQGWAQPGYTQGTWAQGQYQPGYVQGQYQQQPGFVQGGQVQQGYTQGGPVPMDQSASTGPKNFHRAKQVLGTHVSIEGGLAIGLVEDIVFSDDGAIEFLIVANEGKLVSVPWSAARFNFDQRVATVEINQEQFRQIPTFTASNYPVFGDPQWRTQTYNYFGGYNNRAGYVTPGQERRMERGFIRGRR